MGRGLPKIGTIIVLAAALGGCATSNLSVASIPSAPFSTLTHASDDQSFVPTKPMPAAQRAANTPAGFVSFCLRFADQCQSVPGVPTSVAMTPDVWKTLTKVNDDVNAAIWPQDDSRHYGRAEFWTIPTDGYGDCEDYALTKRKNLMALGLPAPALRIAIVVTPDESRHAVLTVVTDKGDYVLDNLRSDVLPWDRAGFDWIERQDPSNALSWVSLQPADRMLADSGATMITGTTR